MRNSKSGSNQRHPPSGTPLSGSKVPKCAEECFTDKEAAKKSEAEDAVIEVRGGEIHSGVGTIKGANRDAKLGSASDGEGSIGEFESGSEGLESVDQSGKIPRLFQRSSAGNSEYAEPKKVGQAFVTVGNRVNQSAISEALVKSCSPNGTTLDNMKGSTGQLPKAAVCDGMDETQQVDFAALAPVDFALNRGLSLDAQTSGISNTTPKNQIIVLKKKQSPKNSEDQNPGLHLKTLRSTGDTDLASIT
ncbi:hypothetical protein U1Q18_040339 [Sarracenia purpurea var. burkii]